MPTWNDATARARLDRGLIIDAMVKLAHEEPTRRITVKRLGDALGVDATAMYRHFRNLRELNRAGLDRLLQQVTEQSRAGGGQWRERLERHMLVTAEASQLYPSIMVEAFTFDPVGAGDLAWIDFVIERLEESGLDPAEIVRAYGAISSFTLANSAAIASDALGRSRPLAASLEVKWISSFGNLRLDGYPRVSKYREQLLGLSAQSVFRAGAAAILDSIEVRIVAP